MGRTITLMLVIACFVFCALFAGCKHDEGNVLTPAPSLPTIVHGVESSSVSFAGSDLTTEVVDSLRWYPNVAFYSLTVSKYVSGDGQIHVSDGAGSILWRDSLRGNFEGLNRRLQAPMPLHLHLITHSFTGAMTVAIFFAPADLNGTLATLALRDTAGQFRST